METEKINELLLIILQSKAGIRRKILTLNKIIKAIIEKEKMEINKEKILPIPQDIDLKALAAQVTSQMLSARIGILTSFSTDDMCTTFPKVFKAVYKTLKETN